MSDEGTAMRFLHSGLRPGACFFGSVSFHEKRNELAQQGETNVLNHINVKLQAEKTNQGLVPADRVILL